MEVENFLSCLEKKKLFIFDFDGVLVDTSPAHEKAFHSSFDTLKDIFNYQDYSGMKTEDAFAKFLSNKNLIEELTRKKREKLNSLISQIQPFPHAEELLRLLKNRGIQIVLATSGSRTRTEAILKNLSWDKYFDFVFTCEDVLNAKPSPDIFNLALEKTLRNKDEALVVEDAENGAAAAKTAGICVVGVNSQHQSSFDFFLKDVHSLYSVMSYYFFTFKKNNLDNNKIKEKVITIIPAAGEGTRFNSSKSKILYPILNKPIILWLYEKLSPFSEKIILIINKNSQQEIIDFVKKEKMPIELIDYDPRGTGASILKTVETIKGDKEILIIWGDQPGIKKSSIEKLICFHQAKNPDLSLPTVIKKDPYIHLERQNNGLITRVLKKRLGDKMPDYGENDAGIFLTKSKLLSEKLKEIEPPKTNLTKLDSEGFDFLPYISLLSSQGYDVATIDCITEPESIGMNTLEEAKYHESVFMAHA